MGIMVPVMLPKLQVRPVDVIPVWRQIADHVTRCIGTGELSPGEKLPGGRWLAEDWEVGYSTVMKAMGYLIEEGILVTTPGKGTFVAPAEPPEENPGE
jgi:DNA-binding GntR family transcriptional regulator